MIAVVCIYNNKKTYSQFLLKSLEHQSKQFELIGVDNSKAQFGSAAQALNYGAQQIQGECAYIMFAHQDISLCSNTWLEDVELMLDSLPNLGVAGVAGNSEKENRLITNITHGTPPRNDGYDIQQPVRAMAVDECCAIMPADVFKRHWFDEAVCNDWHLYVVEYCLRIKAAGLDVYVLPAKLHHLSMGSLNAGYFKTLKKVLLAHRDTHKKIYTSCGSWDARTPVALQRVLRVVKKIFYGITGRLIAAGLVPAWMQRKKRRRLQAGSPKL